MAEHTPGPWKFGSGDDYFIRAEAYPKSFPHHFKSDDLGDYLAYVGNRTSDFGEANARLIAAAPDLLNALRKARAAIWSGGDTIATIAAIDAALALAVPPQEFHSEEK